MKAILRSLNIELTQSILLFTIVTVSKVETLANYQGLQNDNPHFCKGFFNSKATKTKLSKEEKG
jgi:hypothetical protein